MLLKMPLLLCGIVRKTKKGSIKMGNVLEATAELVNDKLLYKCVTGDNPPIYTDYIPPLGDGGGYMPLQLFLVSMAACTGGVVAPFLRRMGKQVNGLKIQAMGTRRTEHPTGFERIEMDIELKSADATEEDLKKVVQMAKDTYCPVWSMIKGNVEVVTALRVLKA